MITPIRDSLQHVLEVDLVERRLAHAEHQAAPLLQHDVGRARHQRLADAVRDRAERVHAARQHDHAHRDERPARDGRALVGRRVG